VIRCGHCSDGQRLTRVRVSMQQARLQQLRAQQSRIVRPRQHRAMVSCAHTALMRTMTSSSS